MLVRPRRRAIISLATITSLGAAAAVCLTAGTQFQAADSSQPAVRPGPDTSAASQLDRLRAALIGSARDAQQIREQIAQLERQLAAPRTTPPASAAPTETVSWSVSPPSSPAPARSAAAEPSRTPSAPPGSTAPARPSHSVSSPAPTSSEPSTQPAPSSPAPTPEPSRSDDD